MISDKKKLMVQKIQSYIKENFQFAITSKDVAKELCFSQNYCERTFREVTGTTIRDYTRNLQLEQAKALLEKTNLKCYEVAYSSGFESVSKCAETFKKKYGVPMRKYRCLVRSI